MVTGKVDLRDIEIPEYEADSDETIDDEIDDNLVLDEEDGEMEVNNMSDDFHMEISIPADNDGYILLQCPNCGTFFKATPSDIEDDGVLELFVQVVAL